MPETQQMNDDALHLRGQISDVSKRRQSQTLAKSLHQRAHRHDPMVGRSSPVLGLGSQSPSLHTGRRSSMKGSNRSQSRAGTEDDEEYGEFSMPSDDLNSYIKRAVALKGLGNGRLAWYPPLPLPRNLCDEIAVADRLRQSSGPEPMMESDSANDSMVGSGKRRMSGQNYASDGEYSNDSPTSLVREDRAEGGILISGEIASGGANDLRGSNSSPASDEHTRILPSATGFSGRANLVDSPNPQRVASVTAGILTMSSMRASMSNLNSHSSNAIDPTLVNSMIDSNAKAHIGGPSFDSHNLIAKQVPDDASIASSLVQFKGACDIEAIWNLLMKTPLSREPTETSKICTELKKLPFCKQLMEGTIHHIAKTAQLVFYASGDIIALQDDLALPYALLIVKGTVQMRTAAFRVGIPASGAWNLRNRDFDSAEEIFGPVSFLCGSGDCICEESLMGGMKGTSTCLASGLVACLDIEPDALRLESAVRRECVPPPLMTVSSALQGEQEYGVTTEIFSDEEAESENEASSGGSSPSSPSTPMSTISSSSSQGFAGLTDEGVMQQHNKRKKKKNRGGRGSRSVNTNNQSRSKGPSAVKSVPPVEWRLSSLLRLFAIAPSMRSAGLMRRLDSMLIRLHRYAEMNAPSLRRSFLEIAECFHVVPGAVLSLQGRADTHAFLILSGTINRRKIKRGYANIAQYCEAMDCNLDEMYLQRQQSILNKMMGSQEAIAELSDLTGWMAKSLGYHSSLLQPDSWLSDAPVPGFAPDAAAIWDTSCVALTDCYIIVIDRHEFSTRCMQDVPVPSLREWLDIVQRVQEETSSINAAATIENQVPRSSSLSGGRYSSIEILPNSHSDEHFRSPSALLSSRQSSSASLNPNEQSGVPSKPSYSIDVLRDMLSKFPFFRELPARAVPTLLRGISVEAALPGQIIDGPWPGEQRGNSSTAATDTKFSAIDRIDDIMGMALDGQAADDCANDMDIPRIATAKPSDGIRVLLAGRVITGRRKLTQSTNSSKRHNSFKSSNSISTVSFEQKSQISRSPPSSFNKLQFQDSLFLWKKWVRESFFSDVAPAIPTGPGQSSVEASSFFSGASPSPIMMVHEFPDGLQGDMAAFSKEFIAQSSGYLCRNVVRGERSVALHELDTSSDDWIESRLCEDPASPVKQSKVLGRGKVHEPSTTERAIQSIFDLTDVKISKPGFVVGSGASDSQDIVISQTKSVWLTMDPESLAAALQTPQVNTHLISNIKTFLEKEPSARSLESVSAAARALANLKCFSRFSVAELFDVSSEMTLRHSVNGETIVSQGDDFGSIIVVLEGTVSTHRVRQDQGFTATDVAAAGKTFIGDTLESKTQQRTARQWSQKKAGKSAERELSDDKSKAKPKLNSLFGKTKSEDNSSKGFSLQAKLLKYKMMAKRVIPILRARMKMLSLIGSKVRWPADLPDPVPQQSGSSNSIGPCLQVLGSGDVCCVTPAITLGSNMAPVTVVAREDCWYGVVPAACLTEPMKKSIHAFALSMDDSPSTTTLLRQLNCEIPSVSDVLHQCNEGEVHDEMDGHRQPTPQSPTKKSFPFGVNPNAGLRGRSMHKLSPPTESDDPCEQYQEAPDGTASIHPRVAHGLMSQLGLPGNLEHWQLHAGLVVGGAGASSRWTGHWVSNAEDELWGRHGIGRAHSEAELLRMAELIRRAMSNHRLGQIPPGVLLDLADSSSLTFRKAGSLLVAEGEPLHNHVVLCSGFAAVSALSDKDPDAIIREFALTEFPDRKQEVTKRSLLQAAHVKEGSSVLKVLGKSSAFGAPRSILLRGEGDANGWKHNASISAISDVVVMRVDGASLKKGVASFCKAVSAATIKALKQLPGFNSWSRSALEEIVKMGKRITYQPGQWIVEEGKPVKGLILVLHGKCLFLKELPQNFQIKTKTREEGLVQHNMARTSADSMSQQSSGTPQQGTSSGLPADPHGAAKTKRVRVAIQGPRGVIGSVSAAKREALVSALLAMKKAVAREQQHAGEPEGVEKMRMNQQRRWQWRGKTVAPPNVRLHQHGKQFSGGENGTSIGPDWAQELLSESNSSGSGSFKMSGRHPLSIEAQDAVVALVIPGHALERLDWRIILALEEATHLVTQFNQSMSERAVNSANIMQSVSSGKFQRLKPTPPPKRSAPIFNSAEMIAKRSNVFSLISNGRQNLLDSNMSGESYALLKLSDAVRDSLSDLPDEGGLPSEVLERQDAARAPPGTAGSANNLFWRDIKSELSSRQPKQPEDRLPTRAKTQRGKSRQQLTSGPHKTRKRRNFHGLSVKTRIPVESQKEQVPKTEHSRARDDVHISMGFLSLAASQHEHDGSLQDQLDRMRTVEALTTARGVRGGVLPPVPPPSRGVVTPRMSAADRLMHSPRRKNALPPPPQTPPMHQGGGRLSTMKRLVVFAK